MVKATLAVRLNPGIINRVKEFCFKHGIKYSFFVEKALEDELAQEELKADILDLKTLRRYEDLAVPFEEYLKARGV